MRSSRQGITMSKCKTKAILTDLGIFTQIPAYLGIFRHNPTYSGTIHAYSGIFRTLVYSEAMNIQNQRHIWNPGTFRTLAYSESCEICTMERFAKLVNG